MMLCPECGEAIGDDARYCGACGKALAAAHTAAQDDSRTVMRDPRSLPRTTAASPATAAGATMPSPTPAPTVRRRLALAAAVAVIVVIGAVVVLLRLQHQAPATAGAPPPRDDGAGAADAGVYSGTLWRQFDPAEVRAAIRAFDQRIAAEEREAARRTDAP